MQEVFSHNETFRRQNFRKQQEFRKSRRPTNNQKRRFGSRQKASCECLLLSGTGNATLMTLVAFQAKRNGKVTVSRLPGSSFSWLIGATKRHAPTPKGRSCGLGWTSLPVRPPPVRLMRSPRTGNERLAQGVPFSAFFLTVGSQTAREWTEEARRQLHLTWTACFHTTRSFLITIRTWNWIFFYFLTQNIYFFDGTVVHHFFIFLHFFSYSFSDKSRITPFQFATNPNARYRP